MPNVIQFAILLPMCYNGMLQSFQTVGESKIVKYCNIYTDTCTEFVQYIWKNLENIKFALHHLSKFYLKIYFENPNVQSSDSSVTSVYSNFKLTENQCIKTRQN